MIGHVMSDIFKCDIGILCPSFHACEIGLLLIGLDILYTILDFFCDIGISSCFDVKLDYSYWTCNISVFCDLGILLMISYEIALLLMIGHVTLVDYLCDIWNATDIFI